MEYNHISECWAAIREAKTIEEVEDLFEKFPRWSGDWEVIIEDGHYVVVNTYFDPQCDSFDTDYETLDIEVDNEENLEQDIVASIEDTDLEDKIPDYQIWCFGLNKDGEYEFAHLIAANSDSTMAVKQAEELTQTFDPVALKLPITEDIKCCAIEVETVIDFGDYEENIGSIFYELIELD